jgi:hypothetical protein
VVRDPAAIFALLYSRNYVADGGGAASAPPQSKLPAAVLAKSAAATAAVPTAATAAAARSRFFRPGFVYVESAPIELAPIESRYRVISFSIVAHLDETKTSGSSGFTVRHQVHPVNCSVRLKQRPNVIFRGAEAQVSNKYILQSYLLLSEIYRAANEGAG